MSEQETTTREGDSEAVRDERPVEKRAEEMVERVSKQVAGFGRRLLARTREEAEDIVAEAQTIRRGRRPSG